MLMWWKSIKLMWMGFAFVGKHMLESFTLIAKEERVFLEKEKDSLLKKGLHSTFKIYESTFLKIKL